MFAPLHFLHGRSPVVALAVGLAFSPVAISQVFIGPTHTHHVPPPPPPIAYGTTPARSLIREPQAAVAQPYSIGNPTNEEQAYLEMINRARANPAAEGILLAITTDANVLQAFSGFGVNLLLMQTQMAALPPLPPLSMNALLTDSARGQSQDMLANHFQGHVGSDGRDIGARIIATGYTAGADFLFAENVYAYAFSPFYGHAGFEVDWGGTTATGGMQLPPGHRNNIHSASFREVGIGVVLGSNQGVGPQLVTQDFGWRSTALPFVTGVVYQDSNGNRIYDAGEGIGGVRVDIAGSESFAMTASSGGYSVPVPGNGAYTVSFSGGSVSSSQQTAVVTDRNNVKVDYAATVSVPATALGNISTRMRVETGDNVLIGGFILTGRQPKKVLVRAKGPSLPVAGKLANPTLELHGPSGLIASNDNWEDGPNKQEVIDRELSPVNTLECAIMATLPVNQTGYTAILRGLSGGTGVGLVEVFDLDRTVDSKLANISSRGFVQTGDDIMIGGFIIVGTGSQKVVVRAVGPSLSIPGKLADPTLELYNREGVVVASNDNWRSDQEAELIARGLAPLHDLESAIVATLPPTAHTAIVRGKNQTTGVAVVEVFAVE